MITNPISQSYRYCKNKGLKIILIGSKNSVFYFLKRIAKCIIFIVAHGHDYMHQIVMKLN